ncbi:MAG: extensin family protein [Pseudomonadota bacterium]
MERAMAPFRRTRLLPLFVGASALSACGGIVPASKAPSSYGSSNDAVQVGTGRDYPPADRSQRQSLAVGSAQTGFAVSPNDRACHAELSAAGARFSPVPDTYDAPGCNMVGTVKLTALAGDSAPFGLSNLGAVKCQTAKAFSAWARYGVDRAARQILGSPLAQIETMGSYACRNVFGTSRRSGHATGNAIDVSGFVLADGRRITLKGDWSDGTRAEREFLRVVHRSACKRFGTVLGPEYNRAHEDHFHLEGTGARFCR